MSFRASVARRRYYFLISAAVVLLDQVTKILAHAYLRGEGVVVVVPGFFNLWYSPKDS